MKTPLHKAWGVDEKALMARPLPRGSGLEEVRLAQEVIRLVREALGQPTPSRQLPEGLVAPTELAPLLDDIQSLREFVFALANGDLSQSLRLKGYTSGALKMLHAHLKHLTWQTQMVAQGDFSQRVDFMGEFANGFNSMAAKLEEMHRELLASQERYRELAITDGLTGLANRRHFFEQLHTECGRAQRYGLDLAIIMLDLDHFKRINDAYGHAMGDKILQETANRLRASLRDIDLPARYGGEEFVILLPVTDGCQAKAVAERIRKCLAQVPMVQEDGESVSITASLGVSAHKGTGQVREDIAVLADAIIAHADHALYRAKEAGRNRVVAGGSGS